jgi:hypothetical protein
MARSSGSSSGSETKTPLVVALVFFILATLILGVTTYMGYGAAAVAEENAKKAGTEKNTVQTERDKDRERVLFYKVATGVNSPEERTQFEAARFKDEIKAEHDRFMAAMADRAKTALTKAMNDISLRGDVQVPLASFFEWKTDGQTITAPPRPLVDAGIYAMAQQLLAQNNLAVAEKNYADIRKSASDAINALSAAAREYKDATDKLPAQIAATVKKYEDSAAAEKAKYATDQQEARTKLQASADAQAELAFQRDKERTAKQNYQAQVDRAISELESRTDPFQFDKPTGKILRRQLGNKQVEIDLGSADYLRPGIRFSVQPGDTVERGLGSRLKQVKGADGKPEYRIQSKGNIEVVEVIGPHLAIARITDEFDEIRERIIGGDLLYNSAWRKGSADHVALFGIFDLDADGIDDIQLVVNNLTKAGIVVDAYFDLATLKWVGTINERTIFAVEGYYPVLKGLDGNADYKTRLIAAMDEAKKYVKERGAKVVKIRDFFPRIGYDVNLGITDDRINQAAAKYFTAPAAKDAADPNKEGK